MERVYETSLNAALVQLLSSSLYGGVFGVSTFVFTKDNWSLVKQTVVHFIIWFYFYNSYKKSVSKINELTAEK